LKIDKEFRDDHQVKLTVELDPEPFEQAKRRAARQIAKRIKIPGFRPGKAPYGVVLRQVGEGHVVEEALELLIEEQYPEIIKEAQIEPYGPGRLENVPQLDPPTFEFIIPLDMQIELGDYKSIRIPYEIPETSDEEVEIAIENIREQNALRENVERPAEIGDTVFLRIKGKRVAVEDETDATIVEERFSSSVIREDPEENEWPFLGFSKELIGISADEGKTIQYQFPDDHPNEKFKGIQAEFEIMVTNIQTKTIPDVDDDLAKSASEFDTLEEWQADLKTNLKERNELEYAQNYDDQILEQIISSSTIKYPPQIIEREKEEILKGLDYRLSRQGLTKEIYLQIRGMNEEGLNEEITPIAEERVKRAMVLMEIAKTEEIKADPDQLEVEMGKTVQAISSNLTPNEAKKFAKSEYMPSLVSNVVADLLTQSTMEFLRASAKGEKWIEKTDKPVDEDLDIESVDAVQADSETSTEESHDKSEVDADSKQDNVLMANVNGETSSVNETMPEEQELDEE